MSHFAVILRQALLFAYIPEALQGDLGVALYMHLSHSTIPLK